MKALSAAVTAIVLLVLAGFGAAGAQGPDPQPAVAAPLEEPPQLPGLGFLHPLPPPPADLAALCRSAPACRRDRVHVFFVNGLDPFWMANLNSLAAYVQSLGFGNVECGQMFSGRGFQRTICELRRADPCSRFVLVGYSCGANRVRSLAHRLNEEGIDVELLVYLGGDTIRDGDESRPCNVRRILNITGRGYIGYAFMLNGDTIQGAENIRINVHHLGLPSRPETVEAITRALLDVVCGETAYESAAPLAAPAARETLPPLGAAAAPALRIP